MWKNIKNFFKWVADHTGVSWILRKISSGWRSGNKTNQPSGSSRPGNQALSNSRDSRISNLLQDKPGVFDVIKKGNNRHLVLHIARDNTSEVFGNNNYQDLSKYQVYIECDKGVFKVTLELGVSCSNPFYSSFNVFSITPYGRDTSYSELEKMENMLGLSEGKSPVIITQISKILPSNCSLRFTDGKIKLVTSNTNYEILQTYCRNKKGDGTVIDSEFRVDFTKLDKKLLYITGRCDSVESICNAILMSINSVWDPRW